jgi:23S rRNA pseudouridine955/2504/2580 synthase
MKELIIDKLGDNQRLDKYLSKYLSAASKSFIYKMLRKKNITLNDKKADGSEKLQSGDSVKIFFSDETLNKFSEGKSCISNAGSRQTNNMTDKAADNTANEPAVRTDGKHTDSTADKYSYTAFKKGLSVDYEKIYRPLDIVYEDENVLFINKPVGMLSQKADKNDCSLVEYITAYLLHNNSLTYEDLAMFTPSICNRLDRNTSGIIAAGKTMKGLQELSSHFKERTLAKYYICIVAGKVDKRQLIKGYLYKDKKLNKVTICQTLPNGRDTSEYLPIETEYIPVAYSDNATLLKVHLITGRSHQIRAHLASINHPLAGDYKYGKASFNRRFTDKYNCKSQLLHSYELNIPDMDIHIHTDIPDVFLNVLKGENIWQPGIQEVLEALH